MQSRKPGGGGMTVQRFANWNVLCQRESEFLGVHLMKRELLATACGSAFLILFSTNGQPASPQNASSNSNSTAAQRALLDKYCASCHGQRTSNGISLDAKSTDLTNVAASPEKFEKVVRKIRAGMMPPSGAAR